MRALAILASVEAVVLLIALWCLHQQQKQINVIADWADEVDRWIDREENERVRLDEIGSTPEDDRAH